MIILVNGATKTIERYPELGRLIQPRSGNSIELVASGGRTWAADNDCFQGLNVDAYWKMIINVSKADRSRLLWVTVPDVVGNAQETCNLWFQWRPQLAYLGLPCAFVGQDGIERIPDQIPWDDMTCLFIGGTDSWKLTEHSEALMREAKSRGKLVHIGRVNTKRRLRDILLMSRNLADSIDGRSFSAWPDKKIPWMLRLIQREKPQGVLF